MSTLVTIEDFDSAALLKSSESVVMGDKQCRITLTDSWRPDLPPAQRFVALKWHDGRKPSLIQLLPGGRPVVQPLYKAQVWFGPFALPMEYAAAQTDREREFIRDKYHAEKMRVLNMYDYARPLSKGKDGYEPIGPHRLPDVTCVVIESDGSESEPMRLHQIYKIGEFDEAYPLSSFGYTETPDDLKARHEFELKSQSEKYEREIAEMRRDVAKLTGLVQGQMLGAANAAKAPAQTATGQ